MTVHNDHHAFIACDLFKFSILIFVGVSQKLYSRIPRITLITVFTLNVLTLKSAVLWTTAGSGSSSLTWKKQKKRLCGKLRLEEMNENSSSSSNENLCLYKDTQYPQSLIGSYFLPPSMACDHMFNN